MPWCTCHVPPTFDLGNDHKVACWLYADKDYSKISAEAAKADAEHNKE